MYSTVGILKNSKHSGELIGTHQHLDWAARKFLTTLTPRGTFFPTYREIKYFEGNRGPDGLKWKSPGVDEPMHFILPEADDGVLVQMILDHQHNLREALRRGDRVRAAFEAAWQAHAIVDGLTPAHHFPYQEAVSELMSDKEYVTIFGQPVKGVMRGETLAEAARNNWLYWGAEGYMTKHVGFEYGVALVAAPMPFKAFLSRIPKAEVARLRRYWDLDLVDEFYAALSRIDALKMYERFRKQGWTAELGTESAEILLPEIMRMVTVGWLTSLPEDLDE